MSNEPNIRNRVAGAVVLVSLAVILLPLILDGKKKNQIIESYIPDKPNSGEIILVNVEESLKRDQSQNNQSKDKDDAAQKEATITIDAKELVAEPEKKVAEVKKEPPKVVENKPQPKRQNRPNYDQAGYLVQLGSFSSSENAANLVTKLNAAGYRAYSKRGDSAGKRIYRVFAGPYLQKTKAESDMSKMQKIESVKPIVVTYDPIKHARG